MGRGSYLGGSTIVYLDKYGPARPRPEKHVPPASRRSVAEREWLAANKRKGRKKRPGSAEALALKGQAQKEAKRRKRRAKKARAKIK